MKVNFNDTAVIDTHYGKIEIVYVPKRSETDVDVFDAFNSGQEYFPEVKESHYIAQIMNGRFEGWYATDTKGRKSALKNLMLLLAGQYASDLLAGIE